MPQRVDYLYFNFEVNNLKYFRLENVIDKKIKYLFGEEFFESDKKILNGKDTSSFNTSKQHVSSSETEISEDGNISGTIFCYICMYCLRTMDQIFG